MGNINFGNLFLKLIIFTYTFCFLWSYSIYCFSPLPIYFSVFSYFDIIVYENKIRANHYLNLHRTWKSCPCGFSTNKQIKEEVVGSTHLSSFSGFVGGRNPKERHCLFHTRQILMKYSNWDLIPFFNNTVSFEYAWPKKIAFVRASY